MVSAQHFFTENTRIVLGIGRGLLEDNSYDMTAIKSREVTAMRTMGTCCRRVWTERRAGLMLENEGRVGYRDLYIRLNLLLDT